MATPNFAFNLAMVRGRKRNVILRALAKGQLSSEAYNAVRKRESLPDLSHVYAQKSA
jgi:hypothetical protein